MLCNNPLATIIMMTTWLVRRCRNPLPTPIALVVRAILPVMLVSACSSSLVGVKPDELAALQFCQESLQQQQRLSLGQQEHYSDSLALLHDSLEQQRRQLEMMPPPLPAEQPKPLDCPKPPRNLPPAPVADTPSLDKQLVGERERVLLNAIDVLLRARINTGVSLSQLDARDLQTFERNGEEWVRFTVIDRRTDTAHELERKRLRYIQLTKADESSRRPVVELRITIGKLTQTAEFILADRSNQTYPLLIGRNVLRDLMLVDVSRSDLAPVANSARDNPEDTANGTSSQP